VRWPLRSSLRAHPRADGVAELRLVPRRVSPLAPVLAAAFA